MALTALTLEKKTFGRDKFSTRTTFHNETIILRRYHVKIYLATLTSLQIFLDLVFVQIF